MGFYFELRPKNNHEWVEQKPETVYWLLWAIATFSLTCMMLATRTVMRDLSLKGTEFDRALIASFALAWPVLLLSGLKLLAIRKFIVVRESTLIVGYLFFGKEIKFKSFTKDTLKNIALVHRTPSSNRAKFLHSEKQYYVQGHWKLVVTTINEKNHVLDSNTDKDALMPIRDSLNTMLNIL